MLTTPAAAVILGVSQQRVRQLISEGRLEAKKEGRDWLIEPDALDRLERRPPGRPRKEGR